MPSVCRPVLQRRTLRRQRVPLSGLVEGGYTDIDCYSHYIASGQSITLGKKFFKLFDPLTLLRKSGSFKTAQKMGRDWFVDEDEPWPDRRVKNGDYIGWRKKQKEASSDE